MSIFNSYLNGRIQNSIIFKNNTTEINPDNIFTPGIYRYTGNGENDKFPIQDSNGLLVVSGTGIDLSVYQLWVRFNSQIFIRMSWSAGSTTWSPWGELATNSNCLMHMQDFSGDFNSTTIPPGIYRIRTKDTYSHGPKSSPQYATFIQFFNYNIQYIIDGRTISMRKYVGSPAAWEPWYTINGTAES